MAIMRGLKSALQKRVVLLEGSKWSFCKLQNMTSYTSFELHTEFRKAGRGDDDKCMEKMGSKCIWNESKVCFLA